MTAIHRALIETCNAMTARDLSPGKSGNISVRTPRGMLITPTGMAYDTLTAADLVPMTLDGTVAPGHRAPSSEWHFHAAIYRARADAGAIVHCHSRYATGLACAHKPIPAFHYMVAVAGGASIPLATYATFGTAELAQSIVATLGETLRACLIANHGQIALAGSVEAALALASEVETLAAQYVVALASGGPHLLDADEMARNLEKFTSYGQQPATDAETA